MTEPKRRNGRVVSAALKRGGVLVGLKYTATGYITHNSGPFPGPGVRISRHRGAARGNQMDRTDVGGVQVFLIQDRHGLRPPTPEFVEQVAAALSAAGLPFTRNETGSVFFVPDEVNPIVGGQS